MLRFLRCSECAQFAMAVTAAGMQMNCRLAPPLYALGPIHTTAQFTAIGHGDPELSKGVVGSQR